MIEKSTILVTSIGRTGTKFFSKFFANIIPDCTSLHEPDIIKLSGENRLEQFLQQTRQAGIWRMVFLKALGKWTVARLSEARFLGKFDDYQAIKELHKQRASFVSQLPGSVYIESNLGYFGVLDILPMVFKNYKAIYIIRDGRDWVRSVMNWEKIYERKGVRKYFSHKWPAASDISKDPYSEKWPTFSRFEKLCWAWSRLNEYALETVSKNPHSRLFYFENLFSEEGRYDYLNDLVGYATDLPGIDSDHIGKTEGWLERKIYMSSHEFPHWKDWTTNQKTQFEDICGPLMRKLGYKPG